MRPRGRQDYTAERKTEQNMQPRKKKKKKKKAHQVEVLLKLGQVAEVWLGKGHAVQVPAPSTVPTISASVTPTASIRAVPTSVSPSPI
jgi:hypothetical protein